MKKILYQSYEKHSQASLTHFCPGCGHGSFLKLLAKAIDTLNIQERVILVLPVGCGGLSHSYIKVNAVLAAHGRASAVAAAIKRLKTEAIVIALQGDGDFTAIGLAESLHAANRNDNITVFCLNNGTYGMTGGQRAPTSQSNQPGLTEAHRHRKSEHGETLRPAELLQALQGPSFIARAALGSVSQLRDAQKWIKLALEQQMKGFGYSFLELLSACPANWRLSPIEAKKYLSECMIDSLPVGIFRYRQDVVSLERAQLSDYQSDSLWSIFQNFFLLNFDEKSSSRLIFRGEGLELKGHCSLLFQGMGGQGVLTIGQTLAKLLRRAHFYVSYLPYYSAEKRGGLSQCHLKYGTRPLANPYIDKPDFVLLLDENTGLDLKREDYKTAKILTPSLPYLREARAAGLSIELSLCREDPRLLAFRESRDWNFLVLGHFLRRHALIEQSCREELGALLTERQIEAFSYGLKLAEEDLYQTEST